MMVAMLMACHVYFRPLEPPPLRGRSRLWSPFITRAESFPPQLVVGQDLVSLFLELISKSVIATLLCKEAMVTNSATLPVHWCWCLPPVGWVIAGPILCGIYLNLTARL